jgi:predicted neutral ceramidase superfamily lipid hydrolase
VILYLAAFFLVLLSLLLLLLQLLMMLLFGRMIPPFACRLDRYMSMSGVEVMRFVWDFVSFFNDLDSRNSRVTTS